MIHLSERVLSGGTSPADRRDRNAETRDNEWRAAHDVDLRSEQLRRR